MGMYTEFQLNVELKANTPTEVLDTLREMVSVAGNPVPPPTDDHHILFLTDRWRSMLTCDSYYFAGDTRSTLRYDQGARAHLLNVQCNLKNYDGEIEKFIDWIAPYVVEDGFAGYSRHEEADEPTLIYFPARAS